MEKVMATTTLSALKNNDAAMGIMGVAILFAGAQISIPLEPVPITLQTVSAMLIGLTYSKRAALFAAVSYWTLSLMGLPLLAGLSFGPAKVFGPSGGYLAGFVVATILMPYFKERMGTSWLGLTANCLISSLITFVAGISWLSTFVGMKQAVIVGLLPFIVPGLVKVFVLSGSLYAIKLPVARNSFRD